MDRENVTWNFAKNFVNVNSVKTRLGCGLCITLICAKIASVSWVCVGRGPLPVSRNVSHARIAFLRQNLKFQIFLYMNPYESVRDSMIFYFSNFIFYYKIIKLYEMAWQNLLYKICSTSPRTWQNLSMSSEPNRVQYLTIYILSFFRLLHFFHKLMT